MPLSRHAYYMFGLNVSSAIPFDGMVSVDQPSPNCPAVTVDLNNDEELDARFSGAASPARTLTMGQTETVEVAVGTDQDVLLSYSGGARFHVAAGGRAVLCAPAEPRALGWRRALLDTVLATAALSAGRECLHGAAVALRSGVLAIMASSGGGKSTLCADLLRRGAHLFADDLVFLSRDGPRVLAHPGPPLMNLANTAAAPDAFGERLGVIDGEQWVAVRNAARMPAPLLALIYLDRGRSLQGARLQREPSPTPLLASALDSGPDAARLRTRLELLGDLAREAACFRLSAGSDVPPSVLGGMLQSAARERWQA